MKSWRIGLAALAVSLAATGAAAQVALSTAPPAWGVGPFKLGMTLDEVRAAAPNVVWEEQKSAYTGKVLALSGQNALSLGDWTFRVDAAPGYYGAYELTLTGAAPAKNRKQCRAQAVALVAALEPRLGALTAGDNARFIQRTHVPARVHVTFNDKGVPIVGTIPGYSSGPTVKTLKAGASSEIEVIESGGDMRWSAQIAKGARARGDVRGNYTKSDIRPCSASVELVAAGYPPARETIAFEQLKLKRGPSVSTLHYSLDGASLPSKGVTVEATCQISRRHGGLSRCSFSDTVAEPLRKAVRYRASDTSFDAAGLDADNAAPLYVTLPFRLSPSERLKNPPPQPQTILVSPPAIKFARKPTSAEIEQYYPDKALRLNIEASTIARCTVRDDFHLACDPASVTSAVELDSDMKASFQAAALQISRLAIMEPTDANGDSSAGARISLPIRFVIP